MKNNLNALNNYLFEELERLNDDETLDKEEYLDRELKRAKGITEVSNQIVQNAKIILDAKKHADSFGYKLNTFYQLDNREEKREDFKKQFIEFSHKVNNENN